MAAEKSKFSFQSLSKYMYLLSIVVVFAIFTIRFTWLRFNSLRVTALPCADIASAPAASATPQRKSLLFSLFSIVCSPSVVRRKCLIGKQSATRRKQYTTDSRQVSS